MTQSEKDKKITELLYYVAERAKDAQMRCRDLSRPDDKSIMLHVVKLIRDDLDDIVFAYNEIEYIDAMDTEEETDDSAE